MRQGLCDISTGELDSSGFTKPMPLIGLYIAGATMLCFLLMAVDIFTSFRVRIYWIRCKLFGLNATTLALLSVATKLPGDLNTSMPGPLDQLTKISGTVLLCTSMGFSMQSLGTMEGLELLSNVVALSILVVTVFVNICIQMRTGAIFAYLPEHVMVLCIMLLLLFIMGIAAVTKTLIKEAIEEELLEKRRLFASQHSACDPTDPRVKFENCKTMVSKVWMVTHTSNLQHATSLFIGTAVEVLALSSAVLLLETGVSALLFSTGKRSQDLGAFCKGNSDYGWSIQIILASQGLAILLASVAISTRLFHSVASVRNSMEYLKIESQIWISYAMGVLGVVATISQHHLPRKWKGVDCVSVAGLWASNSMVILCMTTLLLLRATSTAICFALSVVPFLFRSSLNSCFKKARKSDQGEASAANNQRSALVEYIVYPPPKQAKQLGHLSEIFSQPTDAWIKRGSDAVTRKVTPLLEVLACLDGHRVDDWHCEDPVWLLFRKHVNEDEGCCDLFLACLVYTSKALAATDTQEQHQSSSEAEKLESAVREARKLLCFADKYAFNKQQGRDASRLAAKLMWRQMQARNYSHPTSSFSAIKDMVDETFELVAIEMFTQGFSFRKVKNKLNKMAALFDIRPLKERRTPAELVDWLSPRIAYILLHCCSNILNQINRLGGDEFELQEEDVREAAQVLGMIHGLHQRLHPLFPTVYNHSAASGSLV